MKKHLKVKKTLRVPGIEYREANLNWIYEYYSKNGLTYRVMPSTGSDNTAVMGGRYERLEDALIARDCLYYLRPSDKNESAIRPYYTELDLQKMANQRDKVDILGLYQHIKEHKSLQNPRDGQKRCITTWR